MDQIGQGPVQGKAVKQFFFTKKPDALYAITSGWLAPQVTLRNLKIPANPQVTLLGVKGALKATVQGKNLVIEVPSLLPSELPSAPNYTFKIVGAETLPD
jgi:alpha-L-fucosidase